MPNVKNWNKCFLCIFASIVALAAALRFYKLGQVPVSLYWDEIAMLVDAKSLAATAKDMHGLPIFQSLFLSYGDYKLPIYIWLATFSVKIFTVSNFALRLPSALAGIGSVMMAGFLAKRLLSTNSNQTTEQKDHINFFQLIAMLVMTISPWSLTFSRTGFEGHVAQFILSISVWFLLQKKSFKNSVVAVLFGSLATYCYFSVRYVWPVLAIGSLIFIKKENWKKQLALTFLSILMFSISLLPMTKSPLYNDSNRFRLSTTSILNKKDWPVEVNVYRQTAGNHFYDKFIFNKYTLIGRELLQNYSDHLDLSYIFIYGDDNLRHGTSQHGLFLWPFILPFIIGIFQLAKNNKKQLAFLIIWWLVALLPASVPETTPHALRSLNGLMPLTLIIAFGCYKLLTDGFFSQNKFKVLFSASWVLVVVVFFISYLNFYYRIYPKLSEAAWQNGYAELAEFLLNKKDSVRTVWIEPFDLRFYLWLLANPDYSADQIQSMVGEQHMPARVENIELNNFDWNKLSTLDHKIIIVGKKSNMESSLENAKYQPRWIEEVGNPYQEEVFLVVGYGN